MRPVKHKIHVVAWISSLFLLCIFIPNPEFVSSKSNVKMVYLTFDDGPSLMYTPKILEILRDEHIHATFFVLGSRVQSFPHIAQWIVRDGHEIGNHGYYHEYLRQKRNRWVVRDIKRTDKVIRSTTGQSPKYYRPPGGIIPSPDAHLVRELGHPIALWTVDSHDWTATNPQQITANVLQHIRPGAIVLFHDGVSNSRYTIYALPVIIHSLKIQGYRFASLPTA